MFNEAMRAWWRATGNYFCAKCREPEKYLEPLEVSHFHNVRKSGTRFDPLNVDPLHRHCHTGQMGESWEYQKHQGGAYHAYMLEKLGEPGFTALRARAHRHKSLEEAKAELVEAIRGGTLCHQLTGLSV